MLCHLVSGNVIIRETRWGGFVDLQIDKLPSVVAGLVYTALAQLIFFGWTIPIFFGVERFLRVTKSWKNRGQR